MALHLRDRAGRPRVGLAITPDDLPLLAFIDEDGRVIWAIPMRRGADDAPEDAEAEEE